MPLLFIFYDNMFRPLLGHLQVMSFNPEYSQLQILDYLPLNIFNYIYVNILKTMVKILKSKIHVLYNLHSKSLILIMVETCRHKEQTIKV